MTEKSVDYFLKSIGRFSHRTIRTGVSHLSRDIDFQTSSKDLQSHSNMYAEAIRRTYKNMPFFTALCEDFFMI